MKSVVKKWGNSAAVRIPAVVMEAIPLELDEPVDVREEAGRIVIEPIRQKAYDVNVLIKGITSENLTKCGFRCASGQRGLVVARKYVPGAGDIVWLEFTPQAGREQEGSGPAVVLSPLGYNSKTSLKLCCPMATQIKNYPFEVRISTTVPSVVLSDQIKSVDWRVRKAKRKGKVSAEGLAEVRAKIHALIG